MPVESHTSRSNGRDGDDRYTAPALDKGLDILELLANMDQGLTQRQIAESLDRSASEIFRMLTRLEQRGYLTRTKHDDLYRISAKLFVLAHRHPPTRRLHDVAMPILRELAEAVGQSCHLGVAQRGELITLMEAEAPGSMGFVIRPGTRAPLSETGSGTVLLAFQDEPTRLRWLEPSSKPLSRPKRRALIQHLDLVRGRGYEQRPSQVIEGMTDISAPVFDHSRHAIAAVTVPYLAPLRNAMRITQVRQHVLDAARELSSSVGCGMIFESE